LQQLWAILNPYKDSSIDRLSVIELLLVLMINISCKTKKEVTTVIAKYLIKYYEGLCISVQSSSVLEYDSNSGLHDKN
jgi:hypothetical protein